MTIDEFLEARLAEDEAVATSVPREWLYPEDYPDRMEMLNIGPGHVLIANPARVLADIASKRAIIAAFRAENNFDRYDGCGDDCEWKALWYAIAQMSSVYSYHPDFDPSWVSL